MLDQREAGARRRLNGAAAPGGPPTGSRRRLAPVPAALVTAAGWAWRLLLVGVVVWLVVRWLAGLTLVTVPIVLSLLLTALLHRPAEWLRRFLPRWLAGLTVLVLALVVLGGIGYLVAWRVQGQSEQLVGQAQSVLAQVRTRVGGLPGVGAGSTSVVDQASGWVQSHSSVLVSGAVTAGTVVARVVTGLVLTLFLTLFLLIDGDRIWSWCVRLLPGRVRPAANGAGHRAWRVLSGWIGGTAIIALIHAVVVGVTLWLLGTPLVLVLAVLVFIGSFIPVIGAFVFGGLACLVTLLTVGLGKALIMLGVLLVEDLLEGHVYQPLIMGRTLRLHPVAILLALAVGAEVDGIVGALIAVPLAAAVHAAVKYLTGVEDIDGTALRDEDRMAPEPPPVAVRIAGRRTVAGADGRAPASGAAAGAPQPRWARSARGARATRSAVLPR